MSKLLWEIQINITTRLRFQVLLSGSTSEIWLSNESMPGTSSPDKVCKIVTHSIVLVCLWQKKQYVAQSFFVRQPSSKFTVFLLLWSIAFIKQLEIYNIRRKMYMLTCIKKKKRRTFIQGTKNFPTWRPLSENKKRNLSACDHKIAA